MTHSELVEIGYKWCKNKCSVVVTEIVSVNSWGEIPDVIGFNSIGTFLLEAKTSLSDFYKDSNKDCRKIIENGMGDWRFYIAEKGLISVDKLPNGWGLIEINENKNARTVFNPFGKGNIYSKWKRNKKCQKGELQLIYSILRRLSEKKLITKENLT